MLWLVQYFFLLSPLARILLPKAFHNIGSVNIFVLDAGLCKICARFKSYFQNRNVFYVTASSLQVIQSAMEFAFGIIPFTYSSTVIRCLRIDSIELPKVRNFDSFRRANQVEVMGSCLMAQSYQRNAQSDCGWSLYSIV
ncbi:hypothetical protein PF004_g24835 [Phytophthora fragariae]|uniref:Uncharacterized protein n=1 Tax=Phytophthora fragariae TaxID=53985 RepID=A0A6G0MT11_9STRA|nr:hypothetical protein PF004_g24835 [Phytophthora fragariae]